MERSSTDFLFIKIRRNIGQIGTHDSTGDAMVTVLEGVGEFTVGGVKYQCKAGEAIVMPARIPHAVYAVEAFKMLLTVVFHRNKIHNLPADRKSAGFFSAKACS